MWSEQGVLDDYGPLPWNGKKTVIHPSNPVGMAELGALDATFAPLSDVPQIPGYESWYNTKGKKTPFRYVNDDDRDLLTDEKSAAFVAKRLKELEQTPDKPFLIACGFIRPHTPLVVPQKYFDMFPVEDIELPPLKENDRADFGGVAFKGAKSRGQMAYDGLLSGFDNKETALKTYIQAYLASVKFADDQIGKVLDALEKSAFKDNTVVLLFSDHGYHIGEKEELWKYTLWEEGTRIPLMISDPFNKEHHGSVVSHPVSLVDVFPTVKDLCDWTGDNRKNEGGASLDGSSLKPFLENPNVENWSGPDVAISVTASWKSKAADKQHLAARSENFRYIHYYDGREELYDHRNDPHEWDNQAKNPEFSPVLEKMKSKLFAEVKKLEKPKPVTKTVQNNQAGDENEWKNKYFKEHPEADTNNDGKLSWPELKTHQKKSK
jgi:arylsulfatase A-like enzyme